MANEKQYLDKEGFDRLVEHINEGAPKLKTPVQLWGNEFDGSEDISGNINLGGNDIENINDIKINKLTFQDVNSSRYTLLDYDSLNNFMGIVAGNANKLQEVTKAADDSSVIKQVSVTGDNGGTDFNSTITGLRFIGDDGIKTSIVKYDNRITINYVVDTNIIATRTYVDDKINFLINSEGELEDSFDTLKEVDTWIKAHEGEAADIISRQNTVVDALKYSVVLANEDGRVSSTDNNISLTLNLKSISSNLSSSISNNKTVFSIPSATSTTAGVMSAADKQALDNAESKVEIVVIDNDEPFVCAVGKYYRFDNSVGTLAITLPQVDDTKHVAAIELFFTTGDNPQITINGGDAEVRYFSGFSIEPNTTYELNVMWNGKDWVVASAKVE